VERFARYLDALVPFPGWPGIPEVPFEAPRTLEFLAAAQSDPVDLAIQAHGSGTDVNAFVALLGARRTAGFAPRGRMPAVVHPGASVADRRWPAARFAGVADHLATRGLRVVLTGVPTEAEATTGVADRMRARPLDLTGRTSLGALGALLAGASLVVANDTGVGHLAEAVGTPTVRVFGASDPARWASLDADRHAALVPPDLGTRCARWLDPGHPDCTAARCVARGADPAPSRTLVPVDDAIAAVDRLLARTTPRVA
jgi:ADP-heptose:LPS heptosyltransferase